MTEWKFFLDENIDPKVATYLAKEGIVAKTVRDTIGEGADDEADILPYAADTNQMIVTSDVKDFASIPNFCDRFIF